jgi:hypothetical protein
MSAKLVFAWILAILVVLVAAGGVIFGFQAATARSDGFARLAIAALVFVGAGLLYVMARGKFGEGPRLALSGGALVLSLGLLVFWVIIALGSDM